MDKQRRQLDGIIGPVFNKASDVDWQEVRENWEKRTGGELHYSFWRGFFLWLVLVLVFVYLQVAFFDLYFSRRYLEDKINITTNLVKNIGKSNNSGLIKNDPGIEKSFNDLKTALTKKGQYFVFLSYNPLFKSQVVDLSRVVNSADSALAIKKAGGNLLNQNNNNLFKLNLWLIGYNLKNIKQNLRLINTEEIKPYLSLVFPYLDKAEDQFSYLNQNSAALAQILGVGNKKKYLLLFPNNREIRNWGGFSGTYGELTLESGKKPYFFVRDIYALDRLVRGDDVNSTKKPQVANSIPVDLYPDQKIFNETDYTWWFLRNSATSLDFSTNSKRAIWSYEDLYKQNKVDGVIALTPDVIADVLKLTGPIEMPDYNTTINAQNFRDVMEQKIEFDNPFKKNINKKVDPKQILADFAPTLEQKLGELSLKQKLSVLQIVLDNFKKKQILVYAKNNDVQKIVEHYGISGELKKSDYDYLAIYESNLNGRKTSLGFEKDVKLTSDFSNKNKVLNELSITIKNNGDSTKFTGLSQELLEIAVPKNAVFVSAQEDENDIPELIGQSEEKDKKILFLNYEVAVNRQTTFVFKYELSQTFKNNWGLLLQKQPGIESFNFTYQILGAKNLQSKLGLLNQPQTIDGDKEFEFRI